MENTGLILNKYNLIYKTGEEQVVSKVQIKSIATLEYMNTYIFMKISIVDYLLTELKLYRNFTITDGS